jgi:hypothetical protein
MIVAGGRADLPLDLGRVPPGDLGPDGAPVDASVDPCSASAPGTFCGQSPRLGFMGGMADSLYTCQDHATARKDTCVDGCVTAGGKLPDSCKPDPCVSATHFGSYCGQSTQLGFGGGRTNWLYKCVLDPATQRLYTGLRTLCLKGCTLAEAGTDDTCRP